jgi:hypothetical protein
MLTLVSEMDNIIHIHRNRKSANLDTFLLIIPILVFFLTLFILLSSAKSREIAQIESNQVVLGEETESK